MTLVCCWLDDSYGRSRITAVADTRAAVCKNGNWHPLSDQTIKLFRVPVSCHRLDDLDPGTGGWRTPYFRAEVAIGFAGYCFEAMTIIALFSRVMEQLVSQAGEPRPEPDAMARILECIVTNYFASHTERKMHSVHFLLFSFSAGRPWIAQVSHVPTGPIEPTVEILRSNAVYTIGDAGDTAFKTFIEETLERISKHARELRDAGGRHIRARSGTVAQSRRRKEGRRGERAR